jgi:hypothetical protein
MKIPEGFSFISGGNQMNFVPHPNDLLDLACLAKQYWQLQRQSRHLSTGKKAQNAGIITGIP